MPPPDLDRGARRAAAADARARCRAAHPFYRARFRELSIAVDRISLARRSRSAAARPARSDYIADPEAFRLRADDLPADFCTERARALGRRLHHRHHQRPAVAVLQHHARRLRDLGPGAPLQRGRGLAAGRPRRQPLSARRLPDRRVSQRHPLRHDRRLAGGARAHRLGAIPSSRCATRSPRRSTTVARVPADRAVGRAELHPPLPRRGAAAWRRSLRRAAGASPRASRCRPALRAELRERLARLGAAAVAIRARYAFTEMQGGLVQCAEDAPAAERLRPTSIISRWSTPTSGRRLPDGESGMLAITHLHRRGTVLLRYLVGDIVTLSRAPCPHLRPRRRAGGRDAAPHRQPGQMPRHAGQHRRGDRYAVGAARASASSRSCSRATDAPGAMDRLVIRIEQDAGDGMCACATR